MIEHATGAGAEIGRLIALDWGTSTLRAFLLGDGGRVLDSRSEAWGIMQLPSGGFSAAFESIIRDWPREADRPVIASGMIGSAQGWVEAPYCRSPAGADELARALTSAGDGWLLVVPGIVQDGDAPDVMRGEETQIVGALAAHPELAGESRLVLPGTHSKWVAVGGSRIQRFKTFMTGELFAVLSSSSILGRLARDAKRTPSPESAAEAFQRGILAARSATGGVAPLLFSARSLVLTGGLAPEASLEFLSGLLIGDEIRSGLADGAAPRALIGDPALCERYQSAFALFGVDSIPVITDAAPTGLWTIAQHASLAGPTSPPTIA